MGKQKVVMSYGLLLIAASVFIVIQILQNGHFLGYASFASVEEREQTTSVFHDDVALNFEEPLVLGVGAGKNLQLSVSSSVVMPLVSCSVSSALDSPTAVFSSTVFSLHTGEQAVVPVSIQVPAEVSDSRNLSLLLRCEGYEQEYVFPFTILSEELPSTSSVVATGWAVQEGTKTKLSIVGYLILGIIAAVFIGRMFHKREVAQYQEPERRKLIPLELF